LRLGPKKGGVRACVCVSGCEGCAGEWLRPGLKRGGVWARARVCVDVCVCVHVRARLCLTADPRARSASLRELSGGEPALGSSHPATYPLPHGLLAPCMQTAPPPPIYPGGDGH